MTLLFRIGDDNDDDEDENVFYHEQLNKNKRKYGDGIAGDPTRKKAEIKKVKVTNFVGKSLQRRKEV